MQIKKGLQAAATAAAIASSGCATIIHGGGSQHVEFTTTPPGASVTIDNLVVGTTPTIAKLKRKDDHFVLLELPGYAPQSQKLESKWSGWVFGNILLGGIIGLAVDAGTGGMYRLSPEKVNTTLTPLGVGAIAPPLATATPALVAAPAAPAPVVTAPLTPLFAKGTVLTLPAGAQIKNRPIPSSPAVETSRPETVTLIGNNDEPDAWWFVKNATVAGWLRASELPRLP